MLQQGLLGAEPRRRFEIEMQPAELLGAEPDEPEPEPDPGADSFFSTELADRREDGGDGHGEGSGLLAFADIVTFTPAWRWRGVLIWAAVLFVVLDGIVSTLTYGGLVLSLLRECEPSIMLHSTKNLRRGMGRGKTRMVNSDGQYPGRFVGDRFLSTLPYMCTAETCDTCTSHSDCDEGFYCGLGYNDKGAYTVQYTKYTVEQSDPDPDKCGDLPPDVDKDISCVLSPMGFSLQTYSGQGYETGEHVFSDDLAACRRTKGCSAEVRKRNPDMDLDAGDHPFSGYPDQNTWIIIRESDDRDGRGAPSNDMDDPNFLPGVESVSALPSHYSCQSCSFYKQKDRVFRRNFGPENSWSYCNDEVQEVDIWKPDNNCRLQYQRNLSDLPSLCDAVGGFNCSDDSFMRQCDASLCDRDPTQCDDVSCEVLSREGRKTCSSYLMDCFDGGLLWWSNRRGQTTSGHGQLSWMVGFALFVRPLFGLWCSWALLRTGKRGSSFPRALRRCIPSCPQLSPDSVPGVVQAGRTKRLLNCLHCRHLNKSQLGRVQFVMGMQHGDATMIQQAVGLGLDLHEDVLGPTVSAKDQGLEGRMVDAVLGHSSLVGAWVIGGVGLGMTATVIDMIITGYLVLLNLCPCMKRPHKSDVERIFHHFDGDGDGKLSKMEYQNYLQGIGSWGSGRYTESEFDAKWEEECESLESTPDGITWTNFRDKLYGEYRHGAALQDLTRVQGHRSFCLRNFEGALGDMSAVYNCRCVFATCLVLVVLAAVPLFALPLLIDNWEYTVFDEKFEHCSGPGCSADNPFFDATGPRLDGFHSAQVLAVVILGVMCAVVLLFFWHYLLTSAFRLDWALVKRPASFVMPVGTATPLVLCALGESQFLTEMIRASGGFSCENERHVALRLALLTNRAENARIVSESSTIGVDARDSDGRSVLQWLLHQLYTNDPEVLLSFCKDGGGFMRTNYFCTDEVDWSDDDDEDEKETQPWESHRWMKKITGPVKSGSWYKIIECAVLQAVSLGANVHDRDPVTHKTPVDYAIMTAHHEAALESGDFEFDLATQLVEAGADPLAEISGVQSAVTTAAASSCVSLQRWGHRVTAYAGRFQVSSLLHRTSVSVIYAAVDLDNNERRVAVKIMTSEQAWRSELSFRVSESSKLVSVIESLRIESRERMMRCWQQEVPCDYVTTMPLLDVNLADAIRQEPLLSLRFALRVLKCAAQGLDFLHTALGVVHCDVRPSHLCRTESGEFQLLDLKSAVLIGDSMKEDDITLTAYTSPEASHAIIHQQPLVAALAIDVWSLGAVFYELVTGQSLFTVDRASDRLNGPYSKAQLMNWRTIDMSRLEGVVDAGSQNHEDARSVLSWMLQSDQTHRPTVTQVLQHRFVTPSSAAPQAAKQVWHFFLSHFQKEASDLVRTLFLMMKDSGCHCWLDMEAADLTLPGMREGVEASECFVLVLTAGVLFRPYCVEEIFVACKLQKPMVLICEEDEKFDSFQIDAWRRNWHAGNSDFDWCLEQLSKMDSPARGMTAANAMMDSVARMIEANCDAFIPYRRRGFESKAMISEVLRRNHMHPLEADDGTRFSLQLSVPSVALVYSSSGREVAVSLRTSFTACGLQVHGMAEVQNASRVLAIFTDGALEDADVLDALQHCFALGGPVLQVVHDNWSFGSAEHVEACRQPNLAKLFQNSEFMTFRERPASGDNAYEHDAMVDEMLRRFAAEFTGAARTAGLPQT